MTRILDAKVTVLGQTFTLSSNQLSSLSYNLGAQERSSSCSIKIIDVDLKVADVFYKWSRSKGGLKIPAGLRGSSSGGSSSPSTNPTGQTTANPNPGSAGTGSNAGKLEGLESLPLSYSAFLETIGWCENRGYGKGNLYYNVIFTGKTFSDYKSHPCEYMPNYAVICSGGYCSNASGAFQLIGCDPEQAWQDLRNSFPKELPGSFAPKYQNIGAMLAIKKYNSRSNDAHNKIQAGGDTNIIAAAHGVSWFWASLPGAPYGQPSVTDAQFLAKYKEVLKRREGASYVDPTPYNSLHDIEETSSYFDSSSWTACRRYADVKKQVTVVTNKHGNDEEAYKTIKWLVEKNGLVGSFCMVANTAGGSTPGWRSKDFATIGDELYQYQAIFHVAGLFVGYQKLIPIPGYNAPGAYVKPSPQQSPLHPSYVKSGASPISVTPVSTQPGATTTPVATTEGEKIIIAITTPDGIYKHTFILTDTSVDGLPVPELNIQGQAIRVVMDQEKKAQNYDSMSPQELAKVVAYQYGFELNDYSTFIDPIDRYEQRYTSDLQLLVETAQQYGIIVSESSEGDKLELYDSSSSNSLIIPDIVDITFSDSGVVDEKPQYPVNIRALTSQSLLKLKPEAQISLSSVYNLIPASLKNDTWVINTITHDIIQGETTLDLMKYIEKNQNFSTSGSGVQTPTLTESELLEKYKSAVVRYGSASGAFITSDGYILTADHMKNAKDVVLLDGRRFTAQIIANDVDHDFMLAKIDVTGVNFFSIAPDSSIWEKDKSLESNPIYKLGHGWTSEDGRGEGGKVVKPWDITASRVTGLNQPYPNSQRKGKFLFVDDKNIDFANPGDSGCPWFDKWGFIVTCTSGGNRNHAQGAGKGEFAWGGETVPLLAFLDKYKVKYTKGIRNTAPSPSKPSTTGNVAGTINANIVAALGRLGKFSTSDFFDPRNACAFAVNKVIAAAGYRKVGSNTEYVPSVREALQAGRGKLISANSTYSGAQGGDIWIYKNCRHIGLFINSSTVRSNSSNNAAFVNDDSNGDLFGIYATSDGWGGNNQGECWRLVN